MTYKQLLQQLQLLSPELLEYPVVVYDSNEDKMIAVVHAQTAEEDDCDVIDPDQLYLILKA